VQAAAHGQARTAVALMELCPFPLPAPSESRTSALASARLLQALWSRCCEEHVGIDPTSIALEAAGGFGEKAVAAAAASRSGGAASAVAAAGATTAAAVVVGVAAVVAGSTPAAERARAEGGEADDIDDLTNIQELIRRELLEDGDDEDAEE
jgi:hypothetical protein